MKHNNEQYPKYQQNTRFQNKLPTISEENEPQIQNQKQQNQHAKKLQQQRKKQKPSRGR